MNRDRIIYKPPTDGSANYNGVKFSTRQVPGFDRCSDAVAPGNGHNLDIYHYSYSGGIANGKYDSSRDYSNYALEGARLYDARMPSYPSRTDLGMSSNDVYATKLIKMTDPSRADVDIPIFVAELKDLPSLVHSEGGKLIKRLSKNYLKYQFGIRPLISDLLSMLNWVALVEARKKELEQLGKTGLRRKRTLGRGSTTRARLVSMNSLAGISVQNWPEKDVMSLEVSGFVRWLPAPGFPSTSADLLSSARRAVLGLTVDAATMWELIPFSWLVDWYGTIGDYLSATRNVVPCYHTQPQIMSHWTGEVTQPSAKIVNGSNVVNITAFKGKLESKHRVTVTSITPFTARLDVLSARQLSILASLFIVKHGKY